MLVGRYSMTLKESISTTNLWKPIYLWQGKRACVDEEWTNCLAIEGTRRFMNFIRRAWDENWPVMGLIEPPEGIVQPRAGRDLHCRDFIQFRELRKAVSKVQSFEKPYVYRQWQ